MPYMDVKKNKENYEVNVFSHKGSSGQYKNILSRDPNRIAQVLLDLIIQGFPILKAINIMKEKLKKNDWMGI